MSALFNWIIPVGSPSAVWSSNSVIDQKESLSVRDRQHDVVWLDITVHDTVVMYVHQSGELRRGRQVNGSSAKILIYLQCL